MQREDFEKFFDAAQAINLPLGLYITRLDGVIIKHNENFKKTIKHNTIVNGETNCMELFQNSADRERRTKWFEEKENQGKWNVEVLFLKNNNDEVIVKDACFPILDSEGKIECFFGYLIDIKDEYRFGRLFENLPIGVYQLDSKNKFVKANEVACKTLGYTEGELLGKDVGTVYANNKELDNLTNLIKEPPYYVKDQKVELVKKDGKKLWSSINSFKIPKSGDLYYGREGTFIDINENELREKLISYVPVGFYIVKKDGNNDIVEHCNDRFAQIFGYDRKEDVIGQNPEIFFENQIEYKKYITAVEESDNENHPLWGYVFKGKKRDNTTFFSEINSQYIRNISQEQVGRVGVVRDKTRETELTEEIKGITSDIGAVLHAYSTALIHIKLHVQAMGQSLEMTQNDLKKQLDYKDIIADFNSYHKTLINTLNGFLLNINNKAHLAKNALQISGKLEIIKEIETETVEKLKIPQLRQTVFETLNEINKLNLEGIPKEEIKRIKFAIRNILKMCGIISLREINDLVFDLDHQIKSFREYVTSPGREKAIHTDENIANLVAYTIGNFKEYATWKNTEIIMTSPDETLKVSVIRHEITRAISNVLHNAIKYSYSRKQGKKPWIQVEVKRENENVKITIENFGVPITKEEIEDELIFKMGYRGIYSTDRRRTGTGFGLNDTYNIVKNQHNGLISIESKPADQYTDQDNYYQPFITKVTIILKLLPTK